MKGSPLFVAWIETPCTNGAAVGRKRDRKAGRWKMPRAPEGRRSFPPKEVTAVKALACDRPLPEKGSPLSRFSVEDIRVRAVAKGIDMSYSTVWRYLHRDALRPWFQRQWLFPTDPLLAEKAAPILDLYHRLWEDKPLGPKDYVLCADEMTGVQALRRLHQGLGPVSKRDSRFEFEYERGGTLCYTALLDVFSGRICGETSTGNGIESFHKALAKCLKQPHLQEAERIFLIVDNGSAHHPSTSPARIQAQFPQITTLHLPVHSSWLNQVELFFSIVHRKVLTPANCSSLAELKQRLHWFEWLYNKTAAPFNWKFDRAKLKEFMKKLGKYEPQYVKWAEEGAAPFGPPAPIPLMN